MKFRTPQRWVQALLIVSLVSDAVPLTGCAAGITEEDACRILNCDTLFFVEGLIADMNADDMHGDNMDMGDDDMHDDDIHDDNDMHDDDEMHDGDEEGEDEHEEGDDEHDEGEEEHEEEHEDEGGGLA